MLLLQPDTVTPATHGLEVAAGKLPTFSTPASPSATYLETSHRAVPGTARYISTINNLQTGAETYADWATTEATFDMLSASMTLADLLSCPCKVPKQMHLAATKPDKALQGILQDPALSDSSKHLCSAPQGNLSQARATNKYAGSATHDNPSMDQTATSRSCHAEERGHSSSGSS